MPQVILIRTYGFNTTGGSLPIDLSCKSPDMKVRFDARARILFESLMAERMVAHDYAGILDAWRTVARQRVRPSNKWPLPPNAHHMCSQGKWPLQNARKFVGRIHYHSEGHANGRRPDDRQAFVSKHMMCLHPSIRIGPGPHALHEDLWQHKV